MQELGLKDIGYCGEFNVANQLMLNGAKKSEIEFTPAIRPRNGEVIPPCTNCLEMFPQLNQTGN